ncbi:hypothetical protein JQX13_53305 [Archangium violaceum]|uniref:hypothetical protein n=1 Tax=Archangium violaceum TaxID=83451 RepID=UPI00193C5750|nr:hypothetical protein [Archangium violaceum]QRK08577.1 hypothetical protein JQX13_53305 [Archangium violaceum]
MSTKPGQAHQCGKDTYVWLEAIDRADVALATGTYVSGRLVAATAGEVCIPLELKMIGTFWGRGNVEKAYREPGKKRLEHDFIDARMGRRPAKPFSAVGLLVTHVGTGTDPLVELYLRRARELGAEHQLDRVLDEAVPLPPTADQPVYAHQFLWLAASTSP